MTDSPQMIAALYVIPDGVYSGRADVDPWPESRDARTAYDVREAREAAQAPR